MAARSRPNTLLILASTLWVVIAFVGTSLSSTASDRAAIDTWTNDQAEIAAQVVHDQLLHVFADLEALAAFIEHSRPDTTGFDGFVSSVEGTKDAVGVGYLIELPVARLPEYLAGTGARSDNFGIFEFDGAGVQQAVATARPTLYPIQAFSIGSTLRPSLNDVPEVGSLVLGLDAGWNSDWGRDISAALTVGKPTLSPMISVELAGIKLDRVFFAMVPVEAELGTGRGLVIAMMVEPLLLADLDKSFLDSVLWEVVPAGATPTRVPTDRAHIYPIDVHGTTWSLAIAPTDAAIAELRGTPWWQVGLWAAFVAALSAVALWVIREGRRQRRRARRAEQIAADKDRFLASVSHELRTPLTAVTGLASELRDRRESFSVAEQAEITALVADQAEELSNIVEDLLVAARSDIGEVSIHAKEIRLSAAAQQSMDATGVSGSWIGDPGVADADPTRTRQIIRNLLTNAARYGGDEVRIEFNDGPGWVAITVADNGDGVPQAKREAIFESYQSAHEPAASVRSIGLGLYISRALARAMGGDLTYSYDGWSRFRLQLPAAADTDAIPAIERDLENVATKTA